VGPERSGLPRLVTWVIANTKTRSKKSSSGGDLVLVAVLALGG